MTLITMGPQDPSREHAQQLHDARRGEPTVLGPDVTPEATSLALKGYDLSSHNTPAELAEALTLDFVIVKASEGVSYVNPVHDAWVTETRMAERLVGHYHYARPETNGPDAEARFFLSKAKPEPGDVLVLDFEPPSILPAYPSWALQFSATVTAETGAPCWLYTNQSQGRALMSLASDAQKADLIRLPLWKAYYQTSVGDLMGWPTWTAWQYTSTPIDTNQFNGDAEHWRALGVPEETVALTPAEIQAIAEAVHELKRPKMPAGTDQTSLGGMLEWNDNQFVGIRSRLDGLTDALNALTIRVNGLPTAAEIAKATNDEAHRRSES